MAIPLSWDLQIRGAEEVKQKLSEINDQFARGEISTGEYAKGLREANRDSRVFINSQNVQKNLFLATHPILNNFTRAMSVFGSVMRSVSTALILINTAQIAFNTGSSRVIEAQANLNQALGEQAEALAKFGKDSKQYIEATERVNIANVEVEEAVRDAASAVSSFWISLGVGIANIATAITLALPKILPFLSRLTSLGTVGGGLTTIALGFASIGAAMALLAAPIADFLVGLFGLDEWRENNGRLLTDFFINVLPNAIISGVNFMTKMVVAGVNFIVTTIVNSVNSIIDQINRVARKLGLPTIKRLQFTPLTHTPIGTQQGPTLQQQGVSPVTNPWLGSAGGQIVQNITVQGSIRSKEEFNRAVGDALKKQLLQSGFQ